MCYDVSFSSSIESIHDYFPGIVHDDQITINYDAAVHIIGHAFGNHAIIYRSQEDGKEHLRLMEWGCIPFYEKDIPTYTKGFRRNMLNARSERVLQDQKSYWYKIRNRRCLIPVSGIYEHRAIPKWKNKVPYYVKLKDQKMFFLPGLYSVTDDINKETGEVTKRWSYTLITRPANSIMKLIHNDGDNKWRMPLFLPFEMAKEWISQDLTPERYQKILNFEMPSESLDYWPVFTVRTTKPHPEGKRKDELYAWPNLPALEEMQPE
ncbi:MAG: SOS response-associated peptidase family protein [Bacteroidetes bacterium]|nr:SOS response-associated peptidase family protein [Bacteroidota bacterium]